MNLRKPLLATVVCLVVLGHHAVNGDLNEDHLIGSLIAWPILVFIVYPIMDKILERKP